MQSNIDSVNDALIFHKFAWLTMQCSDKTGASAKVKLTPAAVGSETFAVYLNKFNNKY